MNLIKTETPCSACAHNVVCVLKNEYLDVQNSLNKHRVQINYGAEMPAKLGFKNLIDFKEFSIEFRCKQYIPNVGLTNFHTTNGGWDEK